ncbi:hypothetical protein E4T56_gene15487, partial [Termitomyces sp. T112]
VEEIPPSGGFAGGGRGGEGAEGVDGGGRGGRDEGRGRRGAGETERARDGGGGECGAGEAVEQGREAGAAVAAMEEGGGGAGEVDGGVEAGQLAVDGRRIGWPRHISSNIKRRDVTLMPLLPSVLQPTPALSDVDTTPQQMAAARDLATVTSPDQTPIYICALPNCWRLYPTQERLMLHRKREHETQDTDQIIRW